MLSYKLYSTIKGVEKSEGSGLNEKEVEKWRGGWKNKYKCLSWQTFILQKGC